MAKKDLYVEEMKSHIARLIAEAQCCKDSIKDARRDIASSKLIMKIDSERLGIINKRFIESKQTLEAYLAEK